MVVFPPPRRVNLGQKKPAASSPDRAAGEILVDAVPSSSRAKRGCGGGNTTTGERRRVAKVARLPGVEETNTQPAEEAAATPTLTEKCVKLISDLWSDDRNVIKEALTDLYDLAYRYFENTGVDEILRLGGPMAIVQVLKKNPEDAHIQEKGIRALGCFTYSNFNPAKVLVGDIGGMEVILGGMRRHPGAVSLQRCGCGAISNILCGTKHNATLFEESGGIVLVIAAMKAHPHEEYVQCYGCVVLFYMSEWAEYRALIFAAGGAVTIATVMEKYSGNPAVRMASQNAMQQLVKTD
jgi:hypothetical protein